MEESLKKSAKACRAAAAVTAEWIRDTHRSLQKQELRWEGLEQEVRSQGKEIRNLTEDVKNNGHGYDKRLQLLEELVLQQGQALSELRVRYENEVRLRRQENLATARPSELFRPNRSLSPRDVLEIRAAIGEPVSDRIGRPLGKSLAKGRKEPGPTVAKGQLGMETGAGNIPERVGNSVRKPGQGIGKGVSVSVVTDTTTVRPAKDAGASRSSPLGTPRLLPKAGPPIKRTAIKRKSAGKGDEEIGCSGQARRSGGGKTAKRLLTVGALPQIVLGQEGDKSEARQGIQEIKGTDLAILPGRTLQRTGSGAVQPGEHSGHQAGVSGYQPETRGVEPQAQTAQNPDCGLEQKSPHRANLQEKSGTRKRPETAPESGEVGQH